MDLLSRILSLIPVTGRLDVRCHFGAPWEIVKEKALAHEIPYHVLLSGEADVTDDTGETQRLQAGDIILFPHGAPHRLSDGSGKAPAPTTERSALSWVIAENGGGERGADILCGRFLLGVIPDRLLRDHLPERIIVRPTRDAAFASEGTAGTAIATGDATAHDASASRLTGLISIMRGESVDEAPGSVTLVNHLSAALFGFALRFASQGAEAPRGLLALAGRARLQPALSVMFDEPGRPWTLEQFAERCNMSLATFKRQFHDAVGRSATDVLTEVRVTVAGRMLVETGLPVADIAERVGYQSDAAFQRIFKKRIGMTPASYRSSAKTRADPSAAESAKPSELAEASP